jgi:hypothetical protein
MRWPWRRGAELCEPRLAVDLKVIELQTAKEILAEVFGARPGEVEELIRMRLEEKRWDDETDVWREDSGEKLWPATFCLEN